MKIARFNDDRIGVLRGDTIVDVTTIADAQAGAWPPVAMNRLIANFAEYRGKLERAAASGNGLPLSGVKLLTPIPWPSKVIAYPVNYHDHGMEMGSSYRANNQGFFFKPPSSLSGPADPIVLPVNAGRRIDHECELAFVIAKEGRDIPREAWREYVFGYSCLIDAVIRGKEERVTRKGFDTFCPVGPWIVTEDEIGEAAHALRGRLWVNDELRQDANTRDLVLDIPGMIEMASSVMTLYPGDIVASGTPAGVGPIKAGDKVRIEFERVGEMVLDVVQGTTGARSIFAVPPR
jgi:2-keto-4-pentenoate hydratase/2-oxohepta-3-ene-1,7-dioic acid hydratase in catechol pathway